jgi:hypothetical protein
MIKLKIRTLFDVDRRTNRLLPIGRALLVSRQFTRNTLEMVKNKNLLDYQQLDFELAHIVINEAGNRVLIPTRDPRLYIDSKEELSHIFYVLANGISEMHLTIEVDGFVPKEEAKKEAEFILSIGSVRKELSIIKYI